MRAAGAGEGIDRCSQRGGLGGGRQREREKGGRGGGRLRCKVLAWLVLHIPTALNLENACKP